MATHYTNPTLAQPYILTQNCLPFLNEYMCLHVMSLYQNLGTKVGISKVQRLHIKPQSILHAHVPCNKHNLL